MLEDGVVAIGLRVSTFASCVSEVLESCMAAWTSNIPGERDRSCRRYCSAWATVFWDNWDWTASICFLTFSMSGAAYGVRFETDNMKSSVR